MFAGLEPKCLPLRKKYCSLLLLKSHFMHWNISCASILALYLLFWRNLNKLRWKALTFCWLISNRTFFVSHWNTVVAFKKRSLALVTKIVCRRFLIWILFSKYREYSKHSCNIILWSKAKLDIFDGQSLSNSLYHKHFGALFFL